MELSGTAVSSLELCCIVPGGKGAAKHSMRLSPSLDGQRFSPMSKALPSVKPPQQARGGCSNYFLEVFPVSSRTRTGWIGRLIHTLFF